MKSGDNPEIIQYFCVDFANFFSEDPIAEFTVASYAPGGHWTLASAGDAYDNLLVGSIKAVTKDVVLTGEDCVFWEDVLNLYTNQIGSLSSSRLSEMQMALQASQQSISMGTNFAKAMSQGAMETVRNVR
jgi:hypothetical protein